MNVSAAILRAFRKKWEGGWEKWPRMFWAIDLHGVILNSTYKKDFKSQVINPVCLRVLKRLSSSKKQCIILFTASQPGYLSDVLEWFESLGVNVDYVNNNPEAPSNQLCDTASKFYFDILFDDKAGFDMDTDWMEVERTLEAVGEI